MSATIIGRDARYAMYPHGGTLYVLDTRLNLGVELPVRGTYAAACFSPDRQFALLMSAEKVECHQVGWIHLFYNYRRTGLWTPLITRGLGFIPQDIRWRGGRDHQFLLQPAIGPEQTLFYVRNRWWLA